MVKKYTEAYFSRDSFTAGKALTPPKLSHSFANDWIKDGGKLILLRDQLGHNSIETTQQYTNLSLKEREKVMS
ncbi:tyrosine-type recombinase/integrase [Fictibacillus sp. KIGAM418]|uniref:Tyrosine-type recombinase/integrase n=1 Tax=Fictibacillus marinisediminis TaxID=2878389 RepID=A0A9X1XF45_9BACL|nr:tyrosine-type recombinase/integrase [Fictibacillus marinisediminis]